MVWPTIPIVVYYFLHYSAHPKVLLYALTIIAKIISVIIFTITITKTGHYISWHLLLLYYHYHYLHNSYLLTSIRLLWCKDQLAQKRVILVGSANLECCKVNDLVVSIQTYLYGPSIQPSLEYFINKWVVNSCYCLCKF